MLSTSVRNAPNVRMQFSMDISARRLAVLEVRQDGVERVVHHQARLEKVSGRIPPDLFSKKGRLGSVKVVEDQIKKLHACIQSTTVVQ